MTSRQQVIKLRKQSPCATLQSIGDKVGISRERVRQILSKQGLETKHYVKKQLYECLNCGKPTNNKRRVSPLNRDRLKLKNTSLQLSTYIHYTLDTLVPGTSKRVIQWILFSLNLSKKYLQRLEIPYLASFLSCFVGLFYAHKGLKALCFNQSLIKPKRVGDFYSLFATCLFLKLAQLYRSTQWGTCQ